MKQGLLLSLITLISSQGVHAHISQAHGMAHAVEHLWLVLLVAPLFLLLRPLVARVLRQRDPR